MLHRRGLKVDVFERVPGALAGRGAGIVAQPRLIARLDMMGFPMRELGIASTQRRIVDRDGRVLTGRFPLSPFFENNFPVSSEKFPVPLGRGYSDTGKIG
jgi:2-polyprenyl-6-methoxyphenol hydroxylase-like FAD-dependent oxidoreductase